MYGAVVAASWITVGLSDHRVESLGPAEAAMEGHQVIVLEEPPAAGLAAVLDRRTSISEHLDEMLPEFPEYSRRQYQVLRRLHGRGVRILQVEPFMAGLEKIHELFETGSRPDDILRDPELGPVYQAEREWTGTLLSYYAASASEDFDRVVDSVCGFARADARRGRLRDRMRAAVIASAAADGVGGVYVEAGTVHAGLVGLLRRKVPRGVPVRPRWLLGPVMRDLGEPTPIVAPGDVLTVAHTVGRELPPDGERLLAARSLIHVAISVKDELLPSGHQNHPHTVDDVRANRLVARLCFDDCRLLYPSVRSQPVATARSIVEHHLAAA